MRRFPLGALLSLATLVLGTFVASLALTVEARGRVIDDWNDTPIAGAQVRLGSREVATDADGRFVFGYLPRGSRLNVRARTYRAVDVPADQTEIRLEPGTLNILVFDAKTGNGVNKPQARKGEQLLREGTESGDLAIVHPGRDEPFIICAEGYQTQELRTTKTHLEVRLEPDPKGGCPKPTPSPTPAPPPSPSPSPSPSPTASP